MNNPSTENYTSKAQSPYYVAYVANVNKNIKKWTFWLMSKKSRSKDYFSDSVTIKTAIVCHKKYKWKVCDNIFSPNVWKGIMKSKNERVVIRRVLNWLMFFKWWKVFLAEPIERTYRLMGYLKFNLKHVDCLIQKHISNIWLDYYTKEFNMNQHKILVTSISSVVIYITNLSVSCADIFIIV